MAKKAKEVVEAAPKFKQPWLGFLVFGTVLMMAYIVYQWFLHPVWGLATHMVKYNAMVMALGLEGLLGAEGLSLGLLLSLNNPMYMALYPLGYLVDWIPYFIFCIVWVFTIAFLALWVPVAPLKRQPWAGLGVLAASAILAYITWYILAIIVKMKGYEMIILGTSGFLVFPIWVTLFNYWPFATPKRMGMHPLIKGGTYAAISWILAIAIYHVVNKIIWGVYGIQSAFTQYVMGIPLMPLLPFEPYDYWNSLLLSIIVGATIISIINPWAGKIAQPKRGLLLFLIAIVLGVAMWSIITFALNPSSQTLLIPGAVPWLFTFTYTSHAVVAAYVAFPLVTLLAGQLAFQMWPWNRWGTKGNIGLVITAFVVGTIVYYLFMVNPGWAIPLMGGNLIVPMSGLESLYLFFWGVGAMIPSYTYLFIVFGLYFEGLAEFVGHALLFAWILTVGLFGLLAYEAFHRWPWG
ncbi:MAG: hypothetical protein QW261_10175 [Candidatus Jordarchaeaceae archaeon]